MTAPACECCGHPVPDTGDLHDLYCPRCFAMNFGSPGRRRCPGLNRDGSPCRRAALSSGFCPRHVGEAGRPPTQEPS